MSSSRLFISINKITLKVIKFINKNTILSIFVCKRVIYNIYDLDETSMANLVKISKKIINTDYDLAKSTHHAPVKTHSTSSIHCSHYW
jgi:hypothetical protein